MVMVKNQELSLGKPWVELEQVLKASIGPRSPSLDSSHWEMNLWASSAHVGLGQLDGRVSVARGIQELLVERTRVSNCQDSCVHSPTIPIYGISHDHIMKRTEFITYEEDGIAKGRVVRSTDPNAGMIEDRRYGGLQNLESRTKVGFGKDERIYHKEIYGPGDIVLRREEFSYDNLGRIIRLVVTDSFSNKTTRLYSYDQKGRRQEIWYIESSTGHHTFERVTTLLIGSDKNGPTYTVRKHLGDGNIEKLVTVDAKGNVLRYAEYSNDGSVIHGVNLLYDYDQDGNIREVQLSNKSKAFLKRMTYIYDRHGNWIERRNYQPLESSSQDGSNLVEVTYRTFKYLKHAAGDNPFSIP